MSGGGYSDTVYNWQLDPAYEREKRVLDAKSERDAKVKCDYCGGSYSATRDKCPSCGARK